MLRRQSARHASWFRVRQFVINRRMDRTTHTIPSMDMVTAMGIATENTTIAGIVDTKNGGKLRTEP